MCMVNLCGEDLRPKAGYKTRLVISSLPPTTKQLKEKVYGQLKLSSNNFCSDIFSLCFIWQFSKVAHVSLVQVRCDYQNKSIIRFLGMG